MTLMRSFYLRQLGQKVGVYQDGEREVFLVGIRGGMRIIIERQVDLVEVEEEGKVEVVGSLDSRRICPGSCAL